MIEYKIGYYKLHTLMFLYRNVLISVSISTFLSLLNIFQ